MLLSIPAPALGIALQKLPEPLAALAITDSTFKGVVEGPRGAHPCQELCQVKVTSFLKSELSQAELRFIMEGYGLSQECWCPGSQ